MGRTVARFFSYLFVISAAIIAIFPIFALILASFKPMTELLQYGLNLKLQPDKLTLIITLVYLLGRELPLWYKTV